MKTKLRVYLAGPIRGCTDEQKHWWRSVIINELDYAFSFEDPTEWADDMVASREIGKLEKCNILVANMWKESIGTTLGIVRGCQRGLPVVLMDPNRIKHGILRTWIPRENHMYTIEAACTRLLSLKAEYRPFRVLKNDGTEQTFSPQKVARSVAQAAAAAWATDAALEEYISGPAIARIRQLGGKEEIVASAEIRGVLFDQLGRMRDDPGQPPGVRSRAGDILKAWERREARKGGDRSAEAREQVIADLEAERIELRRELAARDARIRELERNPPSEADPPPTSLTEALERLARDYADCVVVHEHALESAADSPYRHVDEAWSALQLLGRYAREGQVAALLEDRFPGGRQWFRDHRDEAPGLEYAAKESEATTAMHAEERTVTHEGSKLFGWTAPEARGYLRPAALPAHLLRAVQGQGCGDALWETPAEHYGLVVCDSHPR